MRRIILPLFLIAFAVAATGDELPRFFIERIEVQNARRVSRDVIVAESRLRYGRAYSESELREAAERLRRAPYLLSADFALQKGAERGNYVLVITVNETKPFFYDLNAEYIRSTSPQTQVDTSDLVSRSAQNPIALGYRRFIGRHGEFHFGLETAGDTASYIFNYSSFLAGYTQYEIFGSHAFVTANVTKPARLHHNNAVGLDVAAGIPLSINQTLTIEYTPTYYDSSAYSLSDRTATARWSYNTTNHPVLPTRGSYISIAPSATWTDRRGVDFFHQAYETHGHIYGVEMTAVRWQEFGDRDSAGAGILAGIANVSQSGTGQSPLGATEAGTSDYATFDLMFAHSLWTAEHVAASGDSRLQLDVRAGPRSTHIDVFRSDTRVRQMSVSWIRRNSWGLVRLGVGYAW